MAGPPIGTVTFLFTDIEGSTKLWEQNSASMSGALSRHDTILKDAIEERGGFVFKTVGDAFCAAFPTAPEALEAALEAQFALFAEGWSEEHGPLRVRMALHTGAAEERDGDYFGPPLNRVARLLSSAHGGQTLLSLATQELVRDLLPVDTELRDLGEHRLKDLARRERVYQVVAPGLPAEFPPLRTLESRPNNLPMQPTLLVGREREVAEVADRLRGEGVRLLALTGPGGTGKTRVGLQAAADLLDEFGDGVFFVPLSTLTDPGLVASSVAQALGVRETGEQSPIDGLKNYLRDKELLLVLDNFEQVLEAAPVVTELLAAPNLKVLATSRIPLGLYGENEYAVPPLSVPDPKRLPGLEALSQYEAVRLFIERAQATKADFTITSENAPAVAEICARLDGLPLAIELAAARIKLLPPKALLERLGSRLKLLTGGARDLPARQRTLRGAIEWSYDLLDEGERTLFARLSVFAGGRTLEAVEAVCEAEGDLPVDPLDGVSSLLDKSLLRQEEGPDGEPRFVMLETIHEYARERLEESGEAEEIKRAHAEYFLALAEEAELELEGADQIEWLEKLEGEHDNMRAALSWSLGGADAKLGLKLAGALWLFWEMRGHHSEGRRWLGEALAEERPGSTAARAKALCGYGWLATSQGDLGRAAEVLEESLALYRDSEHGTGTTRALAFLGFVAFFRSDHERAEKLGEEALVLSRRMGDRWNLCVALNVLAGAAEELGNRERAAALRDESLALARKAGDAWSTYFALINEGVAVLVGGDFEQASAMFEEALEISRKLRDNQGLVYSQGNLGWAALHQGDHGRARELFAEALELTREMGLKRILADCLDGLAGVAATNGDAERTARLWGAAEALRDELAAPVLEIELTLHEPYRTFARSRLDAAAFEEAFQKGRTMTLEEAVSYALAEEEAARG